jgi:serine/threonine protein kinase
VRAAAALSHPNIVHAYDADEIGGTHLLVMECVEGAIDLNRLVKRDGPLPVSQACEYMRQTALGLQHACERGLVHRDIKPHNLLLVGHPSSLTPTATVEDSVTLAGERSGVTVKILDMGLARLDDTGSQDDKNSTMTQEGAVMGTLDYIAPEQAADSHTVDIRADLYSLGCTFYFLLTGHVPFPGGTGVEKLLRHRRELPVPITQHRPDVPPRVAAVVARLMAKRPEDRYQTPAELAQALAHPTLLTPGARSRTGTVAAADVFATLNTDSVTRIVSKPAARTWPKRRLYLGTAAVAAALVLVWLLTPSGSMPLDTPPAVMRPLPNKPAPAVEEKWIVDLQTLPVGEQIEVIRKKLRDLNPNYDGNLKFESKDGVVTNVELETKDVADISPLRGLTGLRLLLFHGEGLRDLSPLAGLKLNTLLCVKTSVRDLTPLSGMPLVYMNFDGTPLDDLGPLEGLPLQRLHICGTKVRDLSPLRKCPLQFLICHLGEVTDLSPIKDLPLRQIWCDYVPERDAPILRAIKTLEVINDRPAAEILK